MPGLTSLNPRSAFIYDSPRHALPTLEMTFWLIPTRLVLHSRLPDDKHLSG